MFWEEFFEILETLEDPCRFYIGIREEANRMFSIEIHGGNYEGISKEKNAENGTFSKNLKKIRSSF